MKALIWNDNGKIKLEEKPFPKIKDERDAIVKVELSSICTSDLHIIHGAVPSAVPNTTLGHEFVGKVVAIGSAVKNLKINDRVAANCITFCGECWFCRQGFINNCEKGGWEIGCKIDGCQADYVRVPYADTGLTKIPDKVSYEDALFVGDILSSGYFGAELCEIKSGDTIAVIGCGPVGICAMQCARILGAKKIIAIDINQWRLDFVQNNNLADICINSKTENVENIVNNETNKRGADGVIEAAGGSNTLALAWKIARPNSIVGIVAMYEEPQILPLPQMYGKNLIFKTGGVDAIHCEKLLNLIEEGKISTDMLISKKYTLNDIVNAYNFFENKDNNCFKIVIQSPSYA